MLYANLHTGLQPNWPLNSLKALTLAGKFKQLTANTRRNHGAELPRAQPTTAFHKFYVLSQLVTSAKFSQICALACSNCSNPSKQPPNITLQLGKLIINTARRRPAPSTRSSATNSIYYSKTYTNHFIRPTVHSCTSHYSIQLPWYNGVRHPRLYIKCHTCEIAHPKFTYIVHQSMLCVRIHRYLHVYVGSIRIFNVFK
jgi:hypothetical protein